MFRWKSFASLSTGKYFRVQINRDCLHLSIIRTEARKVVIDTRQENCWN